MKDIKIYPKDWLQLHPYKQSDPTDLYYTNIANRIYGMLEETNLAYSFEKNEVKQISIRMAAYFEDVISGLNIWRSFITEHKALYGKYLPFYTPDDHYYDDEVNYEDIRFLLWHYTQQYHGPCQQYVRRSRQCGKRRDSQPDLSDVLRRMDNCPGERTDATAFCSGNPL